MRPGRERKAVRISLPFPRLREKNRFGMWNRRGSTEIICVYQILTYHRPRKLQHTLRETAGRPGTPPLPLPGAQYQRRGIRPDLGANMASRWETPSQLRSSSPAACLGLPTAWRGERGEGGYSTTLPKPKRRARHSGPACSADATQLIHDGYAELREMLGIADTRQLEEVWQADGTRRQDYLADRGRSARLACRARIRSRWRACPRTTFVARARW